MKKYLWVLIIILMLLSAVSGCSAAATDNSGGSSAAPEPTVPAEVTAPSPTPTAAASTVNWSTAPTAELKQSLMDQFAADTYSGIQVIPLTWQAGGQPVWAAFSTGMRNFNLTENSSHFLALETYDGTSWQELTRVSLDSDSPDQMGPDYIDPSGIRQVLVEPSHLWLEIQGGSGAHSGVYQLLMFDGKKLVFQVSAFSSFPGFGELKDLNSDGIPEVVLDTSDPYVFFYASSIRKTSYSVLRWDNDQQKMVEVTLQPVTADLPAETLTPINHAVELAQAGLWKDAKTTFDITRQSSTPAPSDETFTWDAAIIDLTANTLENQIYDSAFPLIVDVFYGDYAAAVELLRPFTVEQIFTTQPAIMENSDVAGWETELSAQLIACSTEALTVQPDLAAAYFIRGWGEYLANPSDPQALTDVAKAAELSPDDTLFAQAALYMK